MDKKVLKQSEEPPSTGESDSLNNNDSQSVKAKKADSPFSFKKILSYIGIKKKLTTLEEQVADLIEESDPEGTQVSSEERSIVNKALLIGDTKVSDVMIPRTDIVAVEESTQLPELKKTILQKEHTRMPVYKDNLDNITGFIHIKDFIQFLGTKRTFNTKTILREVLFVPPSMKILDLLVKMRSKRVHIAIVLDEYGGTDGLVTLEDIMEEIVGEIEDEHDADEIDDVIKNKDGSYEVSARMEIKKLEEILDVPLSQEYNAEFETIGGLIFFVLGRVPEIGEVMNHESGMSFKIKSADARRIKQIIVTQGDFPT